MDLLMLPVWGQRSRRGPNSGSLYFLALRRRCSGLTLSLPQAFPGHHGLWAFLAGLAALHGSGRSLSGASRGFETAFRCRRACQNHTKIGCAGLASGARGVGCDWVYCAFVDSEPGVDLRPG